MHSALDAALADAAASHLELATLDLGLNDAIGDTGRAALARVIANGGVAALKTLYLPHSAADGEGARELRAACEARGIALSFEST